VLSSNSRDRRNKSEKVSVGEEGWSITGNWGRRVGSMQNPRVNTTALQESQVTQLRNEAGGRTPCEERVLSSGM
jgi:hypothetical protein